MNVTRFIETVGKAGQSQEHDEKLSALYAQLAELQAPKAPWETVSPNIAEIAIIQAEIYQRTYQKAFEQGRAYEKWRQGAMKTMKTNQPWNEPREWCIQQAAELWAASPESRIGEVCESLHEDLGLRGLWQPKRPDGVKAWLKTAAKEGRLTIPPEAQRPGCK